MSANLNNKFSLRVQEVHKKKSLRVIGRQVGISKDAILKIERGFEPSLSNFVKLCVWLGVDFETALKESGIWKRLNLSRLKKNSPYKTKSKQEQTNHENQ